MFKHRFVASSLVALATLPGAAQVAGTEVGVFQTGPGQTPQSFLGTNYYFGPSLINTWEPALGFDYLTPEATYRIDHAGGGLAIYLDIFYNGWDPDGWGADTENFVPDGSDVDMFLVGASGQADDLIAYSFESFQPAGTDPNEWIEIADLEAGTYYVVIDGYAAFDDFETVQFAEFEIYTVPGPSGVALLGGAAVLCGRRRRR